MCDCSNLDILALGLEAGLAGLGGPWEVSHGDDEERVAARANVSFNSYFEKCDRCLPVISHTS